LVGGEAMVGEVDDHVGVRLPVAASFLFVCFAKRGEVGEVQRGSFFFLQMYAVGACV